MRGLAASIASMTCCLIVSLFMDVAPKRPDKATQTAGPLLTLNGPGLRQTNAAGVPAPSGGTVSHIDYTPACVHCSRSSSSKIRSPVYAVNAGCPKSVIDWGSTQK
jgi:hypothetical protein